VSALQRIFCFFLNIFFFATKPKCPRRTADRGNCTIRKKEKKSHFSLKKEESRTANREKKQTHKTIEWRKDNNNSKTDVKAQNLRANETGRKKREINEKRNVIRTVRDGGREEGGG
jgi:lipid II:glycine glycyltransferase (peptidoglycan interpeptide bridge formation enzyme)